MRQMQRYDLTLTAQAVRHALNPLPASGIHPSAVYVLWSLRTLEWDVEAICVYTVA